MRRSASSWPLDERVSYLSSVNPSKAAAEFQELKTPELEGGALREGRAPELWSRESFGLFAQYCAIGLVYGTLPGTIYPFMVAYLNMEGTQTASARVLVALPWSFKFLFGFISDCFPIRGYRRRPYMLLGWVICLLALLTLALIDPGKPYWVRPEYATNDTFRHVKDKDLLGPEITNPSAKDNGGKFIILMMLAAVGYVQAAVACDAVVCEVAQREPEAVRGTTQTAIYTVRTGFIILAQVLSGFFFNGKEYGGDFDFTLSFQQIMAILALAVGLVLPITWFLVHEERCGAVDLRAYAVDFWEMLQTQAMYQVIAYKFFSNLFGHFQWVAAEPVARYWIGVTNLNDKLSEIFSSGVFAVTLWMTGKYGLHWNWRTMTALTTVAVVVLDAMVTLLGVWKVIRYQWFWLGVPIAVMLPAAMNFIVGTFIVVELAGLGNEGIVYGLISTVGNIGAPYSVTLAKSVNALFDVTNNDIQLDSTHVRWHVTYTALISYGMMLLSLPWLVLLPAQKAETQHLRHHGNRSRGMAIFTVIYVSVALCWSITTNVLSIFPSTKCLRIAGGRGCP
ncbi:hypothetical protein P43SY_008736 [Pythium insidiosum]|uniref:Folate-Biopterin Transporter (FBT) family n=1 Tax=Pythium insidiosum TaxID=114742 RepID=A0AAD5L7Q0_PYTIN|nr:hypothetical protein P43SY_008736 [Pythium insidiosum]